MFSHSKTSPSPQVLAQCCDCPWQENTAERLQNQKLWKTRSQLRLTSKVNPRCFLIIEIKGKKKTVNQQVYSASLRHHLHPNRIMVLLCFIFFSSCFLDNGEDLNEDCCEGIYWYRSKAQKINGHHDSWLTEKEKECVRLKQQKTAQKVLKKHVM